MRGQDAWEWSSDDQMQSYLAGSTPRGAYLDDRERRARQVVELFGLDGGQRGFEVGSGEGVVAAAVAPQAGSLLCVDVSAAFLEKARAVCADQGNVGFHQIQGDYLDPLPDGEFDFGYSFNVFIHLDAYEIYHYLLGVARVLRPGGAFLFNFTAIGPATVPMFQRFAARYRDAGPLELPGFMTWYSYDTIEQIAAQAGLRVRPEAFWDEDGVGFVVVGR